MTDRPAAPPPLPAPSSPLLLATLSPRRLLCWPDYASARDLTALLERFGAVLASERGLCLCLRFEPRADGALADATRRIEEIVARGLAASADLEVLLVDDALDPREWPRLGAAVDAVLVLPSAEVEGERARFVREAACPVARTADDARRLLVTGPALRRVRDVGTTAERPR